LDCQAENESGAADTFSITIPSTERREAVKVNEHRKGNLKKRTKEKPEKAEGFILSKLRLESSLEQCVSDNIMA